MLLSKPVSFDFNITSYEAEETQLVFPAGSIRGEIMNVSLVIWDDLLVEDIETIMLYGSTQPELSASFATGQNRVTLSIMDDDGMYTRSGSLQRDWV